MIFLLLKLAIYHQPRLKNLFFIWTLEVWKKLSKTTIYLYILSTSISAILLKSIPKDPCFEDQTLNLRADRIKASIEKYKDHLSIICVKDKNSSINNPKFIFNFVSFEQTLEEINRLNSKKAFQTTDIPVPVIKGNKGCADSSPTDTSPRTISRLTLSRRTLPRRTFPRTDNSPTGHFPEGHFPDWTFPH